MKGKERIIIGRVASRGSYSSLSSCLDGHCQYFTTRLRHGLDGRRQPAAAAPPVHNAAGDAAGREAGVAGPDKHHPDHNGTDPAAVQRGPSVTLTPRLNVVAFVPSQPFFALFVSGEPPFHAVHLMINGVFLMPQPLISDGRQQFVNYCGFW